MVPRTEFKIEMAIYPTWIIPASLTTNKLNRWVYEEKNFVHSFELQLNNIKSANLVGLWVVERVHISQQWPPYLDITTAGR